MKSLCTLSDFNYLPKGLALFESIKEEDIILYYLCLDKKTEDIINKIGNKKLVAVGVDSILVDGGRLSDLRLADYNQFCYSLASYFTNFLLCSKNIDSITYIDSDIYFHKPIKILFDSFGDKSVAIFKHRQFNFSEYRVEGYYNVGVVYFKNDSCGRDVLLWWKDAVINNKYPHLATCGDQKYLNLFPFLCPPDRIFIDGDIGHGAPWLWQLYDFSKFEESGDIIWNGKLQPLVFSHFSKFQCEFDGYVPSSMHHIYTPLSYYKNIPSLKKIYDNYFIKIKEKDTIIAVLV